MNEIVHFSSSRIFAFCSWNLLHFEFISILRLTVSDHSGLKLTKKSHILCSIFVPKFKYFTVFENYSKYRIWTFKYWHFSSIFVLIKVTNLVTLFDRKIQVFKNSPKLTIFVIFNELLSTQNVSVARFARNVEWDFFCDFQTLWNVVIIPRHLFKKVF